MSDPSVTECSRQEPRGLPSSRGRLFRNVSWNAVGALSTRAGNVAMGIAVARQLGPTGVGELGTIQATVSLLGAFAGLGLNATASRYAAELRARDGVALGRLVGVLLALSTLSGLAMAVIVGISATWLSGTVLLAPQLAGPLRLAMPLLFAGALLSTATGILSGLERFRASSLIGVSQTVLMLALAVPLVSAWAISGAIAALIGSTCIAAAGAVREVRRAARENRAPIEMRPTRAELHMLVHYALPALLASLTVAPATWLARSLVIRLPHGLEEYGLFAVAFQWSSLVSFAPSVLTTAMLPVIANMQASGEREPAARYLWRSVAVNLLVSSAVASAIAAGSAFLPLLYGRDFASVRPVLFTLLVAGVLDSVNHALGLSVSARRTLWLGLAINGVWAIEILGLTVLLRGRGAVGLGMAWALAYGLQTLHLIGFSLIQSRRRRRRIAPGG